MEKETICAISTPFGRSGIGVIRVSGLLTYNIIEKMFKPKKKILVKNIPSHTITYGHILNEKNIVIDEVLVTIMRGPKSYTREDMAEIGCHGGIVTLKTLLSLCVKHGAREALPGEFTKRAFINGRIDLIQAESILEIINSKTEHSLQISLKKLQGGLKNIFIDLRKKLLSLLVEIESKINFPEEEEVKEYNFSIDNSLNEILQFIEKFMNRAGKGKIMRDGLNFAIVGRVNAGKSSILNALTREERAIVTDIPGTTRDSIMETIDIKGIPVNIIDTAGIRKVKGLVEEIGIKKSFEWMEKAEINLLVLDGTKKLNEYDKQLLSKATKKLHLIIINKIDLPLNIEVSYIENSFEKGKIVYVSAKTGEGLEKVEEKIYSVIKEGYDNIEESDIFLTIRQERKLKRIYQLLIDIKKDVNIKNNIEIVAEYIKSSLKEIDELIGSNFNEEVLNNIFSQFCIGK